MVVRLSLAWAPHRGVAKGIDKKDPLILLIKETYVKKLAHFEPQGLFESLHRVCDNSHVHESWDRLPDGTFATAAETIYPHQLCSAMVTAMMQRLEQPRRRPILCTDRYCERALNE